MTPTTITPWRKKTQTPSAPNETKTAALEALKTQRIVRHDAVIHELAIDFVPDTPTERGFIVQTYDCGLIRDAWFFIDNQRVPLTSEEIASVFAVADTCAPADGTDPSI